jgi:hypothetical protein
MSIVSLFSNTSFDPEITDILASAFDIAWDRIMTSGSPLAADEAAAATRESLAKNIIAIAETGERDKNRLVEEALSRLAPGPAGRRSIAKDASET